MACHEGDMRLVWALTPIGSLELERPLWTDKKKITYLTGPGYLPNFLLPLGCIHTKPTLWSNPHRVVIPQWGFHKINIRWPIRWCWDVVICWVTLMSDRQDTWMAVAVWRGQWWPKSWARLNFRYQRSLRPEWLATAAITAWYTTVFHHGVGFGKNSAYESFFMSSLPDG